MKRMFLVLAFLVIASMSYAQVVGTTIKVQNPDGSFSFAKGDSSGNLLISGSNVTEWKEQTASLSANVVKTITSQITGTRKFITINCHNPLKTYWVSVTGSATVNPSYPDVGWPAVGTFYLELPKNKNITVISSEAVKLSVMEGGY